MAEAGTLEGFRILVVEDDFLVAEVLIDILTDAGAEVVGPFGWVDEGVGAINENVGTLDCAVLDINLHGLKSYPIADALKAHNIPFVFTTGYSGEAIPDAYRSFPRCEKPFDPDRLIAILATSKQQHTA
ncbi:MAG: response regulator [Rhodospirillales bacterium]|jgi:DNA-binding NtrC family response regulator|nr:response regulator [Rhodospirillales bacterium]